jgi:TldD protein
VRWLAGAALGVAASLAVTGVRADHPIDDDAVRRAMQDELARSKNDLRIGDEPRPHYLAYTITDLEEALSVASFGAAQLARRERERVVRVDLRVGDAALDNSNFDADGGYSTSEWYWKVIPIDDDYLALRRELWLATDDAYRAALERLAAKRGAAERQAANLEHPAPDFAPTRAATIVHASERTRLAPDPADLMDRVVKLSRLFLSYPGIDDSVVSGVHDVLRRRYLSTEGTWIDDRAGRAMVTVAGRTQAPDGMRLSNQSLFTAASPRDLPALPAMETDVRHLADTLTAMRAAPLVETSDAVILFEGQAAGQIVKRLLADHLSGTPLPRSSRGEDRADGSLAARLGQRVGPRFLSAYDDPREETGPGGAFVFGGYRADDEGVAGQRVTIVDKGILTSLLIGRTPSNELPHSNGHGRGAPQNATFQGRIGNLFVSGGGAGLDARKLRDKAAAVAREAGPRTAVYVVRLLEDNPVVAYRLAHGREEPVRGLVLQGLTPRSLRDVVAVGDAPFVYNFIDAGRGRGWQGVPTSIVTPALLFKDVEVRRSREKPTKPPLYAHPYFSSRPAPAP